MAPALPRPYHAMTHRLREMSHTADVGFEVEAPDLEGLFEGAARGLVAALGMEPGAARTDPGALGDAPEDPSPAEPLRLSRPDLERLLVHWLRELLARAMAEGEVPEVDVLAVRPDGEASLRAEVRWLLCSPAGPTREIKGVTYHGLRVAREGESWHARVVLDV